jgi:hypothetical protein
VLLAGCDSIKTEYFSGAVGAAFCAGPLQKMDGGATMLYGPRRQGYEEVPKTVMMGSGESIKFTNTLAGTVPAGCCWAWCCEPAAWAEITRKYNVYQTMLSNSTLSADAAELEVIDTQRQNPDRLYIVWGSTTGTGYADRATEKIKQFKDPNYKKTLTGESVEFLEEQCCGPCALSRNLREINTMIQRLDLKRQAAANATGAMFRAFWGR